MRRVKCDILQLVSYDVGISLQLLQTEQSRDNKAGWNAGAEEAPAAARRYRSLPRHRLSERGAAKNRKAGNTPTRFHRPAGAARPARPLGAPPQHQSRRPAAGIPMSRGPLWGSGRGLTPLTPSERAGPPVRRGIFSSQPRPTSPLRLPLGVGVEPAKDVRPPLSWS